MAFYVSFVLRRCFLNTKFMYQFQSPCPAFDLNSSFSGGQARSYISPQVWLQDNFEAFSESSVSFIDLRAKNLYNSDLFLLTECHLLLPSIQQFLVHRTQSALTRVMLATHLRVEPENICVIQKKKERTGRHDIRKNAFCSLLAFFFPCAFQQDFL